METTLNAQKVEALKAAMTKINKAFGDGSIMKMGEETTAQVVPGTVLSIEREKGILVKCKEGAVWLKTVQPAGKKPMAGEAFANGRNLKLNEVVFTEHVQ